MTARTCPCCGQLLPERAIEVNGMRFDGANHRVFVGEREVPLAPQEYAVLAILAGRPEMVFPDEALINQIATRTEHPRGLIKTLACKIRRKLGQHDIIRRVWGTGYRLGAIH